MKVAHSLAAQAGATSTPRNALGYSAAGALLVFIAAAVVYALSALLLGRRDSPVDAYFDLLASSFLRGHVYLDNPPVQYDLTPFGGHWYVPFPPLPALLLLPWVAIGGVGGVNTVLFAVVIGALNVALAFLLLQALSARGWTRLGLRGNLWLTVLFGVGSVHWYMATLGSVWFLAQTCTALFMLLAGYLAVATGRPVLAGAALAVAMLGRPHVALCLPLLLGIGLQHVRQDTGRGRDVAAWLVGLLAPVALAGVALLGYNEARFGSITDFGYLSQNVARELVADLRRYGQFNLHYVPQNLNIMLLGLPEWEPRFRMILPTIDGMSLLLTTPALVYLVKARQRSPLVIGAWLAVVLLLLPLITYYNTGWWQFGYRFSLDLMTPIMVLLAVAAGTRVGWPMRVLIIVGVLVNAWGVWWFLNRRYFS